MAVSLQVPLAAGSVDIVVFCLSLMGVDMIDFVKEAIRVLTPNGIIKVRPVRFNESISQGSFVDTQQLLVD